MNDTTLSAKELETRGRAILVGVCTREDTPEEIEKGLDELARLLIRQAAACLPV